MSRADLITRCRRCHEKFVIQSALRYLSDYCGFCRRLLGIHGLSPERQAQMAANYRWQLGEEAKHRIITPFEYQTMTQGASRPFVFVNGLKVEFAPKPLAKEAS